MSAPLPLSAETFGLDASLGSATLVQTHIGWVYLIGNYAFKLKKQVKYDFLDFTTLEKRLWACEREIDLNSRLCPDIYIGLCPVEEQGGARRVVTSGKATGTIVDWAVWMKRLPAERMFDRLLEEDAVTQSDVEAIADLLGPFYSKQRGKIAPLGLGDLEAVRFNVEENLREGASLDPALLDPVSLSFIEQRARSFLKEHGKLISERARQGFVVDGHGDLRSENICLPLNAAPVLFDCIEFNDRFRICDSALDAAYLAMDLDSRGKSALSQAFIERYAQACDPHLPLRLLNFYLGYRAFIKGKVEAWIAGDANVESAQKERAASQARKLFDLCVRYALETRPVLIIFCGVSGSGKSTLARNLASRLGWPHVATDWLRDEIVPRGSDLARRYAPKVSAQVYRIMAERSEAMLASGRSVIVDGTFYSPSIRSSMAKMARRSGARSVLIWAACDACNAEGHISKRQTSGDLFGSEASAEISHKQRQKFNPPSTSEPFDVVLKIDTTQQLERSIAQAWHSLLDAFSKLR